MGTKSEQLFEAFLNSNGVKFLRIEEVKETGAKRPDYLVELGALKIMFEVKQLGDDEDDKDAQLSGEWSSTLGAQVRQRISRSRNRYSSGGTKVSLRSSLFTTTSIPFSSFAEPMSWTSERPCTAN